MADGGGGGKHLKRNDGVCGDARPRRGKLETQETSSIRTDHLAGKLSPLFGRCPHSSTPNQEVPSPISSGHAVVLLVRLKQHEQLCALSSRLRLFGEMAGSKAAKFPADQRGARGWRIQTTVNLRGPLELGKQLRLKEELALIREL